MPMFQQIVKKVSSHHGISKKFMSLDTYSIFTKFVSLGASEGPEWGQGFQIESYPHGDDKCCEVRPSRLWYLV